MTDVPGQREPVERLAEEFLERQRRGEQPSVTEYAHRYPDLAGEIRDVFPALLLLEAVSPQTFGPANRSSSASDSRLRQLGPYRILKEIGRGGMGIVYEAQHEALGRHVALKVLPAGSDREALCLQRFEREARAAARLHHTNIVPVFDVGSCDGMHYYAMQLIEGQGLDQVLRSLRHAAGDGPLAAEPERAVHLATRLRTERGSDAVPLTSSLSTASGFPYYRSVAGIGLQVAEALAYAHAQNILHRDIKPANLLLDVQGTIWVTDFGLAKQEGDDLTRTGDVVGTLRYLAPERFSGAVDQRSDLYSLGLTLYELLCLRPAFGETERAHLVKQITVADPPPPSSFDPRLPRDLETIVMKAMAKEPARRYPSARDLADDLQRFLADRPIHARRSGVWEHSWRWCRRNRLVASMAGLLAMVLVAAAVGGILSAYQFRFLAAQANEAKQQAEENARQMKESMHRQNRAYQLLERGQMYQSRGALNRALPDFTEAAALRPDLVAVWTARSGTYEVLRLYELAAGDMARAFELHRSPEASIWYTHAALRLYVGDLAGYARVCSEMVKHFGTKADRRSCWWLAEACTLGAPSGVDPKLTLDLAKRALTEEPKSAAYIWTLAAAQYRAGHAAAAADTLQDLGRPENTRADFDAEPLLALVHRHLGSVKEGRFWTEKASRTFRNHLHAMRTNPSDLYYGIPGSYDLLKLILFYREVRAGMPEAPPTEEIFDLINHARSNAYLGHLASAESYYTQAIERHPGDADLWSIRGVFRAQQEQWAQALADFDQASALEPADASWPLGCRAIVHLRRGAVGAYAQTCKLLMERFGQTEDPARGNYVAWICSLAPGAIHATRAPVRLAERSIQIDPHNAWCHLALGAAFYRAGQYPEAVTHLRHAQQNITNGVLEPDGRALAQLFLSMALKRLGRDSEAANVLTSISTSGPGWHISAACQIVRQEAESLNRKPGQLAK